MGLSRNRFDSPTNNSFMQLAFERCRRLSRSETNKKESVASKMLKSLVNKFGGKSVSIPDLRFLLKYLFQ